MRATVLPERHWPQVLVYIGTDTPVPAGAPLYDAAGREWRFKAAYKPGLSLSSSSYADGEIIVNNGARQDRRFLPGFFPAVEFKTLPPEAARRERPANLQGKVG